MALRGKFVKAQTEINSKDELVQFFNQYSGSLFLLDVYTECFGPCKSMVPCLRKAKADTDLLQLAIVNCDNIDVFKRFKYRSEPSWLFIFDGKVVNSFFGSNIPAMIQLTQDEIHFWKNHEDMPVRRKYELNEMTSIEIEKYRAEKLTDILKKRADAEVEKLKMTQYIEYVIEKIVSNVPESGVTIFMPHVVSRDLYKKVLQAGNNLGLTARERITTKITSEHMKIINFEKINLPEVLFKHIKSKDVFMICWKAPEDADRTIEDLLGELKDAVTEKRKKIHSSDDLLIESEDEEDGDVGLSLRSLSVVLEKTCVEMCAETFVRLDSINVELIEDELEFIRYVIDFSIDYAANNSYDPFKMKRRLAKMLNINECDERFKVVMDILDKLFVVAVDTIVDLQENEKSSALEESAKSSYSDEEFYDASDPKKLHIPAVWTPRDKKTNAALIYLYFRVLTENFLPPDPISDPPHVAVAFTADKLAEVIDTVKPYGKDVITFGYFDSLDWKKTKLLATSHSEYKKLEPKPNDKLVLKVNENSDVLLMLAGLIPDYVSQNDSDGKVECERFFPDGYENAEEEEVEKEEEEEEAKEEVENKEGTDEKEEKEVVVEEKVRKINS